jgi:hypothetical protein
MSYTLYNEFSLSVVEKLVLMQWWVCGIRRFKFQTNTNLKKKKKV